MRQKGGGWGAPAGDRPRYNRSMADVAPDDVERSKADRTEVELSEDRLTDLVEAIYGADPEQGGQRRETRVRAGGIVQVLPLSDAGPGEAVRAEVWDVSRSGIAVLLPRPMEPGAHFELRVPRADHPAIELLCTARHTRRHGDRLHLVGASFGTNWLNALAAMMQPPPLPTPAGVKQVRSREV